MNVSVQKIDCFNIHIYENLCQPYKAEFSKITREIPDQNGLYKLSTVLFVNSVATEAQEYLCYVNQIRVGFSAFNSTEKAIFEKYLTYFGENRLRVRLLGDANAKFAAEIEMKTRPSFEACVGSD